MNARVLTPIKSNRTWGTRSTYWDEANGVVVRRCHTCKEIKPIEEFRKLPADKKFGRDYCCLPCHKTRTTRKHFEKRYYLKAKFGITKQEFDDMMAAQGGACAICLKVSEKTLNVDHDHSTGKVRGLLCYRCNVMLGNANDEADVLVRAAEYLRRSKC